MRRAFPGLLAACLLLAPSARTEDQPWKLVVKRETTRLLAIQALQEKFWAVGEKGACFASADGKLWRRVKPFSDRNLYALAFPEAGFVCAVGEGGIIATTDNDGESWTVQKSGITDDLRGVSFGTRTTGVAVGLRGTLLVTYDGGKSWVKKDAGYGESFFAVTMTSPTEAWVVGERGIMLHSVDAGRTWLSERHASQKWFFSVWFNGDTGWIAGKNGIILRRMMGKWDEIPLPTNPSTLFSIAGESGQCVTIAGVEGSAWATQDAGMSWQKRELNSREDITGIAMSGKNGWAVGTENMLFSTIDGGATWAAYSLESLPTYSAISFADQSFGYIAGRMGTGMIWSTRDGGVTWGQQSPGVRGDLTSIFAVNRSLCFVTGEDVIMKTDNGGLSWRRVYRDLSPEELAMPRAQRRVAIMNSVFFFDNRRGWGVGSGGTVVFTTDEGEYWEKIKTGIDRTLFAVWFSSPSKGFVGGEDGMIYFTDTGGRRWTAQPASSSGETIRSFFFLDGDHGWAVGDGGIILTSVDGGRSWRELRMGGGASLRKVWFSDPMTGWVCGERGLLLKTWDGGQTWVSDKPPVQTDYLGMYFFTVDDGWVVGDRGVILSRRVPGAIRPQ